MTWKDFQNNFFKILLNFMIKKQNIIPFSGKIISYLEKKQGISLGFTD